MKLIYLLIHSYMNKVETGNLCIYHAHWNVLCGASNATKHGYFFYPPCTAESFPILASLGCRSPWELEPRSESLPRCRTMEIRQFLPERTSLTRPTPYETSSFSNLLLWITRSRTGREKTTLRSRFYRSLRSPLWCKIPTLRSGWWREMFLQKDKSSFSVLGVV